MPVLKLKPAVKDYLWGGDRLKREWGIETQSETIAEAWMLSCHPDGASVVSEGEFAGKTLEEALAALGPDPCGTNAAAFDRFPVLIKLIDARDSLSIQVHPDDSYAEEHEGQFGKTEMWFIADAKPNAFLYYGFNREVDRKEFAARIGSERLLEVLNAVPVKKGDVFFISPGTLHAIGAGILIAEIQQSSNVTYRVYDYDRRDQEGKPRELHIEQALAVTERRPPSRISFDPHLAACRYFTVDRLTLCGAVKRVDGTVDGSSFLSILVLSGEGCFELKETAERVLCRKGESLFLPAGAGEWTLEGEIDTLLTHI